MIEKTVYHIKIKFIEPVLGSQPARTSLIERYIRSKLHNEIEKHKGLALQVAVWWGNSKAQIYKDK